MRWFSHDLLRRATSRLFILTTKTLCKQLRWEIQRAQTMFWALSVFESEWRFNDPSLPVCRVPPQSRPCFVAFVIWLSVKLSEILVQELRAIIKFGAMHDQIHAKWSKGLVQYNEHLHWSKATKTTGEPLNLNVRWNVMKGDTQNARTKLLCHPGCL